ncbi:MAG: alpha/beta hydrolase [Nitrospirae bacterium]|nr:MAG: alpha/beta hydrolase [Nitrospirota bacterium]
MKISEKQITIPIDSVRLDGTLVIPEGASAMVVFAHGSGSSRHSPRNKFVAGVLQKSGIGTLLFDLLTRQEDAVYENRFDIPLLTDRLKGATVWLKSQPSTKHLNIGYFGASTGTASAIRAAADPRLNIKAIVSRGGRPDLAEEALSIIKTPTLLIVGGLDDVVIQLNKKAFAMIKSEKELSIIPGATHLFEEQGKLEEAARLAADWFKRYL